MRIPAKFNGRCAGCGGPIARGDEIEYRDKKATCLGCAEDGGGGRISADDQRALAARLGFVSYDEAMRTDWSMPLLHAADNCGPRRSESEACRRIGAGGLPEEASLF